MGPQGNYACAARVLQPACVFYSPPNGRRLDDSFIVLPLICRLSDQRRTTNRSAESKLLPGSDALRNATTMAQVCLFQADAELQRKNIFSDIG
jgi:hypothetical protein